MSRPDWPDCVVKNLADIAMPVLWFDFNAVEMTAAEHYMYSVLNEVL